MQASHFAAKDTPKMGMNFWAASKNSFAGISMPSMDGTAFQAMITSGKNGLAMTNDNSEL
jgi:hypothetical protein